METGAYLRKKGWIQWHILEEITDLEFENHLNLKKCIFRALEQAGTICPIGKYFLNFKIGRSLFGCAEKIYFTKYTLCSVQSMLFKCCQYYLQVGLNSDCNYLVLRLCIYRAIVLNRQMVWGQNRQPDLEFVLCPKQEISRVLNHVKMANGSELLTATPRWSHPLL